MSEAIILGALQKLESVLAEPLNIDINTEEVMDELRMMLDFWRKKESGERSRLNYLLADFAEIAQYSADLTIHIHENDFRYFMFTYLCILAQTRRRMERFGVGKGVSSVGEEEEGIVVGLEKDVQQLIGRAILNKNPDLLISCIKGMIGVGKTTLARQVYNHPAIVEKFKHRRAWVSMSCDTSIHEVLVELVKQMLVELDGDSLLLEGMDNRSLRQMLCQNMEGMPYFIVLDNMPRELDLLSFYIDLPTGDGCRILITCHYELQEDIFYTYEMKTLDSEKSWKLFSKTIDKFTSCENKFSKELERKVRELLKKCGGLPLAIIDVGRQKAKQRLLGIEWEDLFDSIDLSESLKLLEPMYNELDEMLKSCFLHMSFFKENALMREEKLDHIWTTTGTNTRRTLEDGTVSYVTRFYIGSLVSESIIEVVHDFRFNSDVKRCRTNPLLHMLSIKIAEEKLGLEIIRNNENDRPSQSPRHRIIHCGRDKFNHSTNQDKNLDSLIFHGGGDYLDNVSSSYWMSFETLSLLDMEDFGVKSLTETIGTLIELRYLGLRNNYIREIPHSLGGLKKLEVFDIALNFMVEVPDIINEMGSLCHLYMSNVIYPKPLKVDAPLNLETLTYISIYDWTYEVSSLEKMTRLRKLGIEEVDENSVVSKLFPSLSKLKNFMCLTLRGFRFISMACLDEIGVLDDLYKLRLDGRLARLPSTIESLGNLWYLVLVNTCLDEDPMPVLQEMPELRVLKLRNAYNGRQMVIEKLGFPNLDILRINELCNLRDICVEDGGMENLRQLEIKNCPFLETLPEQIKWMSYLRKFKITTKHIATKIRNSSLISNIIEVDISP